ncbi:hypothetical protein J0H58_01655, partial [bacterium]|nr:hypothetical protein [bacterium]
MATDDDYGRLPPHEALRRRVDAALALPAAGLDYGACDTLQRAVDTVCGTGLSGEWADLFVTLVRHTGDGGDRPGQVLELARAARALVDRVRIESWQTTARELCADAVAVRAGVPPVEVVRRVHWWIDLPDGRLVLEAYAEYEKRCRRSRASAVEVRRAIAGLVAACEAPDRLVRVLAEVVQTAGEFGVPPVELGLEIQELSALLFDPDGADPDRYALEDGLVRQFREQGFSVSHLVSLNHEHCMPAPGRGPLLRTWLPTLLAHELTEGPLPGLLLRAGLQPPGAGTSGRMSPRVWDNLLQIVRAVGPRDRRGQALELVFTELRSATDLEKQMRPLRELVQAWAARPGAGPDALRAAIHHARTRQDGHAALLAAAGLPG